MTQQRKEKSSLLPALLFAAVVVAGVSVNPTDAAPAPAPALCGVNNASCVGQTPHARAADLAQSAEGAAENLKKRDPWFDFFNGSSSLYGNPNQGTGAAYGNTNQGTGSAYGNNRNNGGSNTGGNYDQEDYDVHVALRQWRRRDHDDDGASLFDDIHPPRLANPDRLHPPGLADSHRCDCHDDYCSRQHDDDCAWQHDDNRVYPPGLTDPDYCGRDHDNCA
ncbi:hypothetical protein GGF31_002635 [Allomyces arbusculus]|nr:hypothetical protein GGF31_002635 [Allomyces arbusculus]